MESFLRVFLAPCTTMMMRNVLTLMRLGKGGGQGSTRISVSGDGS